MTVNSGDTNLIATLVLSGSPSSLTANWDSTGTNQAMTLTASRLNGTQGCYIYTLENPTAGNKTFRFACSGSFESHGYLFSFKGGNTSGGASSYPHTAGNNGTTGTSLSVTLTSATGNYTVGCTYSDNTISTSNQTAGYIQNVGPAIATAAEDAAGAATVTYTWTYSAGTLILAEAIDIAAAPSSGQPIPWWMDNSGTGLNAAVIAMKSRRLIDPRPHLILPRRRLLVPGRRFAA